MTFTETQFEQVLQVLNRGSVEFIVIGGLAAMAHGNARSTYDVDVVYARNRENIRRLASVLAPYNPYLRGAPPGLPFKWEEKTIRMGVNFTLTTTLGDIVLPGEVSGAGNYEQLLPHSEHIVLFGVECKCSTLERLIQMKRAAGRPKDLLIVAELQALLEERRKHEPPKSGS